MVEAAIENIVRRASASGSTTDSRRNESAKTIDPTRGSCSARSMLASDLAKGITGQAINLDGGALMY